MFKEIACSLSNAFRFYLFTLSISPRSINSFHDNIRSQFFEFEVLVEVTDGL